MDSIPCDVVLLPGSELATKAIEASRALAQFDSYFTLEDGKYYPHLSLYMFQLEIATIPKVKEVLATIARDYPTFFAKAINYSLGEGFGVGYVDPEYEVTAELKSIQDEVIEAINPYRLGMRESDIKKMQDAKGVKLENLQKYGYPAVGALFRPHVTLTRLKEHMPEVLAVLAQDVNIFSGIFDRIGLFEMGQNGTCIRKIAEFELAKVRVNG